MTSVGVQEDARLVIRPPLSQICIESLSKNYGGLTGGLPTPYSLSLMAKLAYKRGPKERLVEMQKEGRLVGWTVLAVAKNTSPLNGYRGLALWNSATRQLVIAHRGTKFSSLGSLYTDLQAVYKNKLTGQINSAVTFADSVLRAVQSVVDTVLLTGHSLGGWLATVTTYSLQYLELNNGVFTFCVAQPVKPHTVVFESPGARSMLQRLFDLCQDSQSKQTTSHLDVTNYVSSPNFINQMDRHIGRLVRIENEPGTGLVSRLINMSQAVKTEHSLDSILETFNADTGYVKTEIKHIINWPKSKSDQKVEQDFDNAKCDGASFTKEAKMFLQDARLCTGLQQLSPNIEGFDQVWTLLRESKVRPQNYFTVTCPSAQHLALFIPLVNNLLRKYPLHELRTTAELCRCEREWSVGFETKLFDVIPSEDIVQIETRDPPGLAVLRLVHTLKELEVDLKDIVVVGEGDHLSSFASSEPRGKCVIVDVKERQEDLHRLWEHGGVQMKTFLVTEADSVQTQQHAQRNIPSDHTTWHDISYHSRKSLAEQPYFKFQDQHEISLTDISGGNPLSVGELLDSQTLIKMIRGEETQLGPPLTDLEDPYVDRSFVLRHLTKKLDTSNVRYFIQGADAALVTEKLQLPQDDFQIVNDFPKLPKTRKNTFYLRYQEGKFCVCTFEGRVQEVEGKELEATEVRSYDEVRLVEDEFARVSIICGEPGSGKSVLLNKMAKRLKERNPTSWVVVINFSDHTRALRENTETERKLGAHDVARFVSTDLLKLQGFARAHFEWSLTTGRVRTFLLLDSFDEISPAYVEFTSRLIVALKETAAYRIFVTTRNQLKTELENRLGQLAISLADFTEENWKDYIKKKDNDARSINEALDRLSPRKKRLWDELKSPLLLSMFTDLVLGDGGQVGEIKTVTKLYESFIQGKERLWRKKSYPGTMGDVEDNFKSCRSLHRTYCQRCAQELLFPDFNFFRVECDQPRNSQINIWRGGILTSDGGVTDRFVHQSFAEYFGAESIVVMLQKEVLSVAEHNFFLNEILMERKHVNIRRFLNDILASKNYSVPLLQTDRGAERVANGYQQWLLHIAAKEDNASIFQYLWRYSEKNRVFDMEKEMKERDALEETPLHWAARNRSFQVLQIPEHRTQEYLSLTGKQGNTVVHSAMRQMVHREEDIEARREWLGNVSFDWGLVNDNGETPLHIAAELGQFVVLTQLLQGPGLNHCLTKKLRNGNTVVHQAMRPQKDAKEDQEADVCESRKQWIDAIVEKFPWESTNDKGETAVHVAAGWGEYRILKYLVEKTKTTNVCLNMRDRKGDTPVTRAMKVPSSNKRERAARLSWLDAIVGLYTWEQQNNTGQTVLHVAADWREFPVLLHVCRNEEILRSLINTQDNDGDTAVHDAMRADLRQSDERVQKRRDWVAMVAEIFDWSSTNNYGLTAGDVAVWFGQFHLLKHLAKEWGSRVIFALGDKRSLREWQQVSFRFPVEYPWRTTDSRGQTVVHTLAKRGKFCALAELVGIEATHACWAIVDAKGNTPLHLAAWAEMLVKEEVSARLVVFEGIADVVDWSLQDANGNTALHILVERCQYLVLHHLAAKRVAREALRVASKSGETPVHQAVKSVVTDHEESSARLRWLTAIAEDYDWTITELRGGTAMHSAVFARQNDVFLHLISLRATTVCLTTRDNEGRTPQDLVTDKRVLEILRLLS